MDCKKCHLPVNTKDQQYIYCNAPDPEPKCVLERDVEELKSKVETILSMLASHADSVVRHSTPTSSIVFDDTVKGSNLISEMSYAPGRLSESIGGVDNFDLLLTNINATVSEEDVQRMVCRCLGARDNECNNVKKLVPRWVDCSTLDFVSFKIVLDRKWKPAAMMSSTWPKNIKFREFKRRLCTWKPDDM
ncbi:uncharacterized protein LOC110679416 [Aedes aegypti]|uniref:Uncharacterized protein n=1 Tax=Aedes aegypti TaxID=7159 RepID=A0A6I8U919_AEDAE|nr:uncharacterized protein LOC110679416 [Aedes aegypti]